MMSAYFKDEELDGLAVVEVKQCWSVIGWVTKNLSVLWKAR
jgi:hypothetical protein